MDIVNNCNRCQWGELQRNKTGTYECYYCHLFSEPIDYDVAMDNNMECDFFEDLADVEELDDNEAKKSSA